MAQQEIHSLVRYTMPGSTLVLYTMVITWALFINDEEAISIIVETGLARAVAIMLASVLIIGLVFGFLLFQPHQLIWWRIRGDWITEKRPGVKVFLELLDAELGCEGVPGNLSEWLKDDLKDLLGGKLGRVRWHLFSLTPMIYEIIKPDIRESIRRYYSILHYLWMLFCEIPITAFIMALIAYAWMMAVVPRVVVPPHELLDFGWWLTNWQKLAALIILMLCSLIAWLEFKRLSFDLGIVERVVIYGHMDEYVKVVRRAVAAVIWEKARAFSDLNVCLDLRRTCLAVLERPDDQQTFRELLLRYAEIKSALSPQALSLSGAPSPA